MSGHPAYKKTPRKILIHCDNIGYYPTVVSEIDFAPKDTVYDLVVCVGKCFRMHVDHSFSIANAELWFERGTVLTKAIFERAMQHYSECEIRNGK